MSNRYQIDCLIYYDYGIVRDTRECKEMINDVSYQQIHLINSSIVVVVAR